MIRQDEGENAGRGIELDDDLPMGSVVYMGRGSFRMEAVALDPGLARQAGIVQPIVGTAGIVTAPLHTPPPERRDRQRDREDSGAPDLRPIFSSQVDVPVLAAPTGTVSLGTPAITLSRAMLGVLGALVLLCGVIVGTAARHLLASPAPLSIVAAPTPVAPLASVAVALPAPVVAALPAPVVNITPPPVVALPAPVKIRAHGKVAVALTAPVRKLPTTASVEPTLPTLPTLPNPPKSAKPWVDPWAE